MGDIGTHVHSAFRDHKDRAYEKYGHLTKEELIALGDRLREDMAPKFAEFERMRGEIAAYEAEQSLITDVFVDFLNRRHRKLDGGSR